MIVTLRGGGHRVYQDQDMACTMDDADKCKRYWLWDYDVERGILIVLEGYYEGKQFRLLDIDTGQSIEVDNVPHPAPGRSTMAIVDVGIAYSPGDIQIIEHKDGGFQGIGTVNRAFCKFERWDAAMAFFMLCRSYYGNPEQGEFRLAPGPNGTLTRSRTPCVVPEAEYESID